MAGLGPDSGTGLVWVDAHGDANTPETTQTGFFDGVPLAVALGWCWTGLASAVPGFTPVPEALVLHVGGRAFDDRERLAMDRSAMTIVDASALRSQGAQASLAEPLKHLAAAAARAHLHVDLDVIDGGWTMSTLRLAVRLWRNWRRRSRP